ncbi:MAG: DUF1236 domain-containing protein [Hyphomicrobiales bacterium]
MKIKLVLSAAALMAAASLPNSAFAAADAIALTDLNLRAGPGPNYDVVGVIEANAPARVKGCIEGSLWCQVSVQGATGWAYSKYLAMERDNKRLIISESAKELDVPTVGFEAPAGTVAGTVAGALVAGPVGAVVGAAVGTAASPPAKVRTYVSEHRVDPVYLEGETVVGAKVPETVELYDVPEYEYRYTYVNRVPVLVDPRNREIVYVYR